MLLRKLMLHYFGQFHNREIELKSGINLIYGENEAGKSTLHAFMKGMLFGIERMRGRGAATKEDLYTRYLPWEYPGAFGGSMDLQIGENTYRLKRSFHANDKSFTVLDLSTGREVKLREGSISELLPGLTEAAFRNTISIEQLRAQTDSTLADQVQNFITNLSMTKSKEVNVAKAVSFLTEQKKALEAVKNSIPLKELQEELEEGLRKEELLDRLTVQLRELQKEEHTIKQQFGELSEALDEETTKRWEQLPAILEKYSFYQELIRQQHQLKLQREELQTGASLSERRQTSKGGMKEDITQAQRLKLRLTELERSNQELGTERSRFKRKLWIKRSYSILPLSIIGTLMLIVSRLQQPLVTLAYLAFGTGLIFYLILRRDIVRTERSLEEKRGLLERELMQVHSAVGIILQRYQVSCIEELISRQEDILKDYYSLEHAKEQAQSIKSREDALEDQKDIVYDTIMRYMQYFIEAEELNEASIRELQEEIKRRKLESTGKLTAINQKQEEFRLRMEMIKWEIASLESNEDELLKNQERYQEHSRKYQDTELELEAIKMALATISELSVDIHDSFGTRLNDTVSGIISEITNQKYSQLKIDEKMEIKVGHHREYVLLERLSTGTIDQIYLALRLAIADLLFGKDKVPLILDDSFAMYDEARVRAALLKLAERQQVILFTCHKREQLILEELGLSYHFVDLSCR